MTEHKQMNAKPRIMLHNGRVIIGQCYKDTGELAVNLLELLAEEAIQVQWQRDHAIEFKHELDQMHQQRRLWTTKADRYLHALLQAEAKCAHAGRNTSAQDIREARLSAAAATEADAAEEEVGQTKQSTIYEPGEAPWVRGRE